VRADGQHKDQVGREGENDAQVFHVPVLMEQAKSGKMV